MKIIKGNGLVPVLYTAHHASHDFRQFADRVALTSEQQFRFSDYGTDATVPLNGVAAIIAEHSRALGDLNRDPDDSGRFQLQDYAQPTRHDIWLPGNELTDTEKLACQREFYDPFHSAIIDILAKQQAPSFVVAWDNTAHYKIGKDEHGNPIVMKPIILSNRGAEGSGHANANEETSCDPLFLESLAANLRTQLAMQKLPHEVYLNLVFKGGYICRTYNSRRNADKLRGQGVTVPVQSFQVEYDTVLTHSQTTLEPNEQAIIALKEAFSAAIQKTLQ